VPEVEKLRLKYQVRQRIVLWLILAPLLFLFALIVLPSGVTSNLGLPIGFLLLAFAML
jgi:hypothetical protein